jgi:hypothetical protein
MFVSGEVSMGDSGCKVGRMGCCCVSACEFSKRRENLAKLPVVGIVTAVGVVVGWVRPVNA